jgi:hypothetical protein
MAERLTRQEVLQSAATTGNGTAINVVGQGREHTFYIVGTGTITAGAVQLETATHKDYSGTWAPIGAPITVTSAANVVQVTGAFLALRAPISTNIAGGGSVTVEYVAN